MRRCESAERIWSKLIVVDPWANKKDAMDEYGIVLKTMEHVKGAGCINIAVAHDEFKNLTLVEINYILQTEMRKRF